MKNVLVIYKKSSYHYYFMEQRPHGISKQPRLSLLMRKKFQNAHAQHHKTLKYIEQVLTDFKINYRTCSRGQHINMTPFDFVITVGGDGTFLEAARSVKRQMILGVNSDPKRSIGRFCAADRKNFKTVLLRVLKGTCRIRPFQRIRLKMNYSPKSVNILNDVLISHVNPAAMSRYALTVNGVKENHRSSGLWVATAVGSSGAIRSAGGKLLAADSKQIQYIPRELFKHHEIQYRLCGAVVSLKRPMVIRSMMRQGMIYADGAHHRLPFSFGDSAHISISKEPLSVICG